MTPADPPADTAATAVPGATGTVVPAPGSLATEPATVTPAAGPVTHRLAPVRRRALTVVAGLTRLLRYAFMVALLAAGVAIGYQAFLTSLPAPTGPVSDAATAGNQPAPVVRELIAAIGRNDADAIRSSVPAEPYKALTSEMARWEIQEVTSVETLATYEDGQRTATAFVMIGRDNSRNPVAINLIVETQAGNIVGFK
jgi:hypothetical protein